MFNRVLQVKMVKSKKNDPEAPAPTDLPFERKAAIVGNYAERIVEKIGGAIVTYIIVDTVRQVLVAKATRQ